MNLSGWAHTSIWTACAHPGPPTDPLLVPGQRGKGTPFKVPSSSYLAPCWLLAVCPPLSHLSGRCFHDEACFLQVSLGVDERRGGY